LATSSSSYINIGNDYEKFCYLSSIRGNFAASGDKANVYRHAGSWIMSVTSGGRNILAEATCVKWSALKTPTLSASNSVKWLSQDFSSTATFTGNPEDCVTPTTQTWWGDAATILSGIGGDLAGINGAFILQNSSAFTPSSLMSVWCGGNPTAIQGNAYSMFMGQPHVGDLPQFWGPRGRRVSFATAGQYVANSQSTSVLNLAPINQAFCYLSGIWGDFDTSSDSVKLSQGYNNAGQMVWKLRAYDANPTNGFGLGAYATCYMLVQQ
jgi:hypothetical protein